MSTFLRSLIVVLIGQSLFVSLSKITQFLVLLVIWIFLGLLFLFMWEVGFLQALFAALMEIGPPLKAFTVGVFHSTVESLREIF